MREIPARRIPGRGQHNGLNRCDVPLVDRFLWHEPFFFLLSWCASIPTGIGLRPRNPPLLLRLKIAVTEPRIACAIGELECSSGAFDKYIETSFAQLAHCKFGHG